MGFPTVLKSNGTSGGDGVRIVDNLESALRAFRKLQSPPLLARALKRALIDRDRTLLWPSLLRRRSAVSAQTLILGNEATSTIACWRGAVRASLHFEVVKKRDATGPSTVLHLIDNAEMSAAAERMSRKLNLSGIYGLDFILEQHTGHAYLIEVNPRATQVGHLTLGTGHDLPAALFASVTDTKIQEAPALTEKDIIALFPQEWLRNPTSSFLDTGFHDVPWKEPDLIRACFRKSRSWNAWRSQQKSMEALSSAGQHRL